MDVGNPDNSRASQTDASDDFGTPDGVDPGVAEELPDDPTAPTPESSSQTAADLTPSPRDLPPSREDIDLLRGSGQFTPSEVSGFIDRKRPFWLAACYSNDKIDEYYGVENFDWKAAAQDLLTAAQKAADVIPGAQLLIDDFKPHFSDPQAGNRARKAMQDGAAGAGVTAARILFTASPEVSAFLLLSGAISASRAVARQKLVACQRAGSCGDPRDFRNVILQTLADSQDALPQDVDHWIDGAVQDVMTDPWTRNRLVDHPGFHVLRRMPRKTASALLWSLFDPDMPGDKDFYNAATIAWWHVNEMASREGAEPAPEYSAHSHIADNIQQTYADHGIRPDQVIGHGLDDPQLFKTLLSPRSQIERLFPSPEMDTVDRSVDPRLKGVAAAVVGMGVRSFLGVEDDAAEGVEDASQSDDDNSSIEEAPSNLPATQDSTADNADGEKDNFPDEDYIEVEWKMHGHHPWPKYMGGPEKQDLYYLPNIRHDLYHYLIEEAAPEDLDYENMDDAERMEIFREVVKITKEFDAEFGTEIYKYMIKNGFPVK